MNPPLVLADEVLVGTRVKQLPQVDAPLVIDRASADAGRPTVVADPDSRWWINASGHPGMASAGMGDVLTGAIAGIFAQCRDPWLAARVGVLTHAMAGDAVARTGGGTQGGLATAPPTDRGRGVKRDAGAYLSPGPSPAGRGVSG